MRLEERDLYAHEKIRLREIKVFQEHSSLNFSVWEPSEQERKNCFLYTPFLKKLEQK